MSELPQPSKESQTTSEQNALDESQNSTTDLKMTPSATPQTTEPGNGLSLTRGGSDGRAIRTRKNKTILDNFEDAVGGRDELIDSLAMYSLDKKQEHFLRLICDPARANDSLVTIARDAGVAPMAILDLFRQAHSAKGAALAMARMSTKLPQIAEDIIQKSVDSKVECPTCFGEKYIAEGVQCPQCIGKGEVFRPSDIDRQKMVTEITGLQKKGPGVQVNTAVQVNNHNSGANMFSKYVKASDEAAYDVIDVIPEEDS
jgi:hypothetical protein